MTSGSSSKGRKSSQAASRKATRDAQAAAAAERAAEQAERTRRLQLIGGSVVVVIVAVIVALAIFARSSSSSSATALPEVDPSAPVPVGVAAPGSTYAYAFSASPTAPMSAPTLEVWEDFQCPACQALEAKAAPALKTVADSGQAKILYRPTTFLDGNLNNDASARATAAWGCAIDAGFGSQYRAAVFANPPAAEGDGFTDEQLRSFAKTAGLPDSVMGAFDKCVADGKYLKWGSNSTAVFKSLGFSSTPTVLLNGASVDPQTLTDPTALSALLQSATGTSPVVSVTTPPAPSASTAASPSSSPAPSGSAATTAPAASSTPAPSSPAVSSPAPAPSKSKKK